jgi:Ca-activated chloride channel family protein
VWISFEHPSWLILLVVIAPIWFMAFHGLDFLVSTRALVTACVRSLVIVLLVAALSQPSLVETSDGISVVVVADSSRSIPTDTRAAAQAWLQDRAANRSSARDRVGVVTFAKNAEIANKPDAVSKINIMSHADDSTASDLSAGVRMAMALMPRDTRNRIVLLSDGNETSGNIVEAAMLARSAGAVSYTHLTLPTID